MKTITLKDFAKNIADYKYAYAYIGTKLTNSFELSIGVDAFDDFDELITERGMDEEEIEEIKGMEAGDCIFNDTYWNIVRIK